MPDQKTLERAKKDKREGKAATTQAGEFVREEIDHIREGKHGARSTQQAIAIGLSKARRAGVDLPPPKKGTASSKTRRSAKRAYEAGRCRFVYSFGHRQHRGRSSPASTLARDLCEVRSNPLGVRADIALSYARNRAHV